MARYGRRYFSGLKSPLGGLLAFALTFGATSTVSVSQIHAAQKADKEQASDVYKARSLFGSYLAARHARTRRDTKSAARFLEQALRLEPTNPALIRQAFFVEVTNGHWDEAERLAKGVLKGDVKHRTARIFLGLRAADRGNLKQSAEHFRGVGSGPNSELTATLSLAWVLQAQGETDEALALLDAPKNASWAKADFLYHKALIAVLSKRNKLADAYFKKLFSRSFRWNRAAISYARFLVSQNRTKAARKFLKKQLGRPDVRHPQAEELLKNLKNKDAGEPLIKTAREGLAEVYHSLGWDWTLEGRVDTGIIYLKLALMLWPDLPIAYERLAYVYERIRKHELAVDAYRKIPSDYVNSMTIGIRIAHNLEELKRWSEARSILEDVTQRFPKRMLPVAELGRLARLQKDEAEAVKYFTRAIKMVKSPKRRHWTHFYQRAQAYDQLKNWKMAEPDLKRAMKLNPDQPQVLNYLGYSWVDRNLNLKRAMALIKKAVKLQPDDGFIVDSLGWAHYKLGNFKLATKFLERAVELAPQDPVLNDHLGDAYWRVGRRREARYQWTQSLTLKPKPEASVETRRKLAEGLRVLPKLKKRPIVRKRPPKKEKRAEAKRQLPFEPFTR